MHRLLVPACALLLLTLPPASATPASHPHAEIRAAAIAALGATGADSEAVLAAGVRVAPCTQPLQAVATGARTAQVRCPDAPGWKLYVPVKVRSESDVVVLKGPIRAGEPIRADQLVVQRRDTGRAAAPVFADPAAVVGQIPSRSLAAGATLTTADLIQGAPLRRGDPVVLLTRIGGVEVRVAGRALGPAGAGGAVSAENVESRRIVRGRLSAPGVVEIAR